MFRLRLVFELDTTDANPNLGRARGAEQVRLPVFPSFFLGNAPNPDLLILAPGLTLSRSLSLGLRVPGLSQTPPTSFPFLFLSLSNRLVGNTQKIECLHHLILV